MPILKMLKKYSIGFISVSKLDKHYTEASHRIFINTEFGIVTIFYYETTNKIIVKGKKFLDKIKNDKDLKDML